MKDTYILGISAFYHDSAAALLKNGEIIAAAQEERFTRKKHDPSFPSKAIEYCLKEAGISVNDVYIAAFYNKPDSILKKILLERYIRTELGYGGLVTFSKKHHSHAASAFYPSPYNNAAVLTIEGMEKDTSSSFGFGRGNRIKIYRNMKFPHSLGLLYSAFTRYCGFKIKSGEYKLMGLAAYGKPRYADVILKNLIDLKEDGSFKLNLKYFDHRNEQTLINKRFEELFGGAPRRPEGKLEQKYMDLARSVQVVTEMAIMNMVKSLHRKTGLENLCLSGALALNCVSNSKVLKDGPFRNTWIQPASSDAGGAVGAAFIAWHECLEKKREVKNNKDGQKGSFLGPEFSDEEVEKFLIAKGITFKRFERNKLLEVVSGFLADKKVVGWFQGRMEFGPRALGSRSIIADPRSKEMKSIINDRIKFRESFRPFAPSVLLESAEEYFELDQEDPYMLLTSSVRKDAKIPSVTHVDNSSRVQTVKREDNPLYYDLIKKFHEVHGCPVVINTSFNTRGEPIVCTPDDAYKCFMETDIDCLVMGSFIVEKDKQRVKERKKEKRCVYYLQVEQDF